MKDQHADQISEMKRRQAEIEETIATYKSQLTQQKQLEQ